MNGFRKLGLASPGRGSTSLGGGYWIQYPPLKIGNKYYPHVCKTFRPPKKHWSPSPQNLQQREIAQRIATKRAIEQARRQAVQARQRERAAREVREQAVRERQRQEQRQRIRNRILRKQREEEQRKRKLQDVSQQHVMQRELRRQQQEQLERQREQRRQQQEQLESERQYQEQIRLKNKGIGLQRQFFNKKYKLQVQPVSASKRQREQRQKQEQLVSQRLYQEQIALMNERIGQQRQFFNKEYKEYKLLIQPVSDSIRYLVDTLAQPTIWTCFHTCLVMLDKYRSQKKGEFHRPTELEAMLFPDSQKVSARVRPSANYYLMGKGPTFSEITFFLKRKRGNRKLSGMLTTDGAHKLSSRMNFTYSTIEPDPESFKRILKQSGPFIFVGNVGRFDHTVLITGIERRRDLFYVSYNDPDGGSRKEDEFYMFLLEHMPSCKQLGTSKVDVFHFKR